MLKDDLIAAKALIRYRKRWLQGDAKSGNCFCSWGAVIEVVRGPARRPDGPREHRTCLALAKQMKRRRRGGAESALINFNDHPSTTHADIMALFDRAIAAAGAP